MKTATIKATYAELFAMVDDGVEKIFSLQAADMSGKPAFIYDSTGEPEEWGAKYGYIPILLTDDAKAVIRSKDPARAEDIINRTEFVKAIAVDFESKPQNQFVIWNQLGINQGNKKKWIIGGALLLGALALMSKK